MQGTGRPLSTTQFLIFGLAAAAFTNIYITQPVLPVLADEFGVDAAGAPLTVSATVRGIAISNLLFGSLGDRYPLRPLILIGGAMVALPSLLVLVIALLGSCAGFFTTHAAASGALNSCLTSSRGRGNALYILFYYSGSAVGITASGYAWRHGGWLAVLGLNAGVLIVPLVVGLYEMRASRDVGAR
jgi:YNFM family putative membrane transporter